METTDQQAGTICIRISFTGLFLFVPEPNAGKMHVLLPRTPGLGHKHRHVARLLVDSAHLKPSDSTATLHHIPAHSAHLKSGDTKTTLNHIPLERWALELPVPTATGSAETDLSMFPRIGSLAGVTNEMVKRNRIRRLPPHEKVAARVTLAAGETVATAKGALWEVKIEGGGSVPKCMTWAVAWVLDIPDNGPFQAQLLSLLNEHVHQDLPPLYPIQTDEGKRVIDLHFYHVPEHELPPFEPPKCEPGTAVEADHFHLYSHIFEKAHLEPPKLLHCDCENRGSATDDDRIMDQLRLDTGSFFTCIVATAPLDPSA